MITTCQDIREIADRTRAAFEARQIDPYLLRELYSTYAQVTDVEWFVEKAAILFPRLNCGLVSVYLRHLLRQGSVERGRYRGRGHTFLLLEDGTIVDITADQYGGPKVYCGPLVEPWERIV